MSVGDEMLQAACREHGVRDERILHAVGQTSRATFLPRSQRRSAQRDIPLPIGDGQTSSQPSLVAAMLESLRLHPGARVLEVGTGSGYQTALLAQLCAEVVSVERNAALAATARERLRPWSNVAVHVGDGTLGWPEAAPYDGIVVSATGPRLPAALAHQLDDGGRIVMPIDDGRVEQVEVHECRDGQVSRVEVMARVRFVPLVGEQGYEEGS